jgi:hypothetical protein
MHSSCSSQILHVSPLPLSPDFRHCATCPLQVCFANGASAMVFDERVFVSLNPFNVYVAQPEVPFPPSPYTPPRPPQCFSDASL